MLRLIMAFLWPLEGNSRQMRCLFLASFNALLGDCAAWSRVYLLACRAVIDRGTSSLGREIGRHLSLPYYTFK